MHKRETIKATARPITKIKISCDVKSKPYLKSFSALAPTIVGTARKNVNSAEAVLETPIKSAPTIVAPERDVPGIIERT